MTVLAYISSGLSLLLSTLFFIQGPPLPKGMPILLAKTTASALSPAWAILGATGAVVGWVYEALWAMPMGLLGASIMLLYIWRCTRDHNGFETAFGADWESQIEPKQATRLPKRRWIPWLNLRAASEPTFDQDVVFWTVPNSDRQLLCDIWRPSNGEVSGLAYIYLHGSAWWYGDKDTFTRPFFRHLVAQGHTVMDVAYRLCPEVDIYGMIGDVKRAVAWMKANATDYGVDPGRIVLGGASAGGHLALLAAYQPAHPELTPADANSDNLSVRGVISHYGPADLLAEYEHYMWMEYYSKEPPVPIGTRLDSKTTGRYIGRMDILLGGHPQETPHTYQLASPLSHVQPDCPPTLLIQGESDLSVPVDVTRAFFTELVESGVPAINVVIPWTDHGFDLAFPQINPAAQSALYDVDRFLALMLKEG